ncbi:hypothetical protein Pcinc_021828 [Petrolisthes cinctipes]|uniref:Dynein assembly factor 3, axonemal n=1 Tax=Petrolisthes cinctipes TaxID=88211 RepID=A0AAE1KEI5_PETCI|nr:hypothetical protein Pcinc_021828 [Petrolisthes cinctipes]
MFIFKLITFNYCYTLDPGLEKGMVQVAVVGAGDPRHLLLTLARGGARGKHLRMYVIEAQVEVYARLLLLVGTALQLGLGLRERVSLLLDLWANLYLRPTSRTYLELTARRLAMSVTDPGQHCKLVGLVNAARLKYRERDALDAVFRSWYTLTPAKYDPALAWDTRQRQLLGTRYDYKHAEADWAWHMRLTFRIQKLHLDIHKTDASNGDTDEVQEDGYVGVSDAWGREFLTWRGSGRAFTIATDNTATLANTSLASVVVVAEGATRYRRVGYWGDLLSGPFPALALASHLSLVNKTQNGRATVSGSELALRQLEYILHQLLSEYMEGEEVQGGQIIKHVLDRTERCVKDVDNSENQQGEGRNMEMERDQELQTSQEEKIDNKNDEEGRRSKEEEMKKQVEEENSKGGEKEDGGGEERSEEEEDKGKEEARSHVEEGKNLEKIERSKEEEGSNKEEGKKPEEVERSKEEEERSKEEEERSKEEEGRNKEEEGRNKEEEEISKGEEETSKEEGGMNKEEEERSKEEEGRNKEEKNKQQVMERSKEEEERNKEEEETSKEEEGRNQEEENKQQEEKRSKEEKETRKELEGRNKEKENKQQEVERSKGGEEERSLDEEKNQQDEAIQGVEERSQKNEDSDGKKREETSQSNENVNQERQETNKVRANSHLMRKRGFVAQRRTIKDIHGKPMGKEPPQTPKQENYMCQTEGTSTIRKTFKCNATADLEGINYWEVAGNSKINPHGTQSHTIKDSQGHERINIGRAKDCISEDEVVKILGCQRSHSLDQTTTGVKERVNKGPARRCRSTGEYPTATPRKKSSVEGGRPYFDYLQLEGVEVILLSPSRLGDLSSLHEVEGGLDVVYLSAATAHLLNPSLLTSHLRPHSTLILETVQMFPELTDNQVKAYEAQVTTTAEKSGWVRSGPDPLCHLTFRR